MRDQSHKAQSRYQSMFMLVANRNWSISDRVEHCRDGLCLSPASLKLALPHWAVTGWPIFLMIDPTAPSNARYVAEVTKQGKGIAWREN